LLFVGEREHGSHWTEELGVAQRCLGRDPVLAAPSAGQVRLAPLYDVASTLPYGADEHRLRLAMKLGKSYAVYPRHDYWPATAAALDLDAEALHTRVHELAEIAPDAFSTAAAAPEVRALASDLPTRLVDLIADRARRCLELLDREAAAPTR
jgi:serine/threonine-protein kinase HipA